MLFVSYLGLLVSTEAFRNKENKEKKEKKKNFCKNAEIKCGNDTSVTKTMVTRCVFDPNTSEDEEAFKTITVSKNCIGSRMCKYEERFVHRGECGKDCDSLSALCDTMNKNKGGKRAGKRGGKRAGKRGGKRGGKKSWKRTFSFCDQNGKPLSKKCDIFSMRCQAIAAGAKKFEDLPKVKSESIFLSPYLTIIIIIIIMIITIKVYFSIPKIYIWHFT